MATTTVFNPFTQKLDINQGGTTVDGPSAGTSTDNAVVRWDGTTGNVIQNSGVILDDSNNITGVASIAVTGEVKLVGSPTVDGTLSGPSTRSFSSGYTTAVGDLVYLDSSGVWQKADADASTTTYSGLLGIAMEVAVSAACTVALPGSFVHATAFPTFTIGGTVYMSATAGVVTQTAPVTTDSAARILGWAVHADKMYFFPAPTYTVHL